MIFVYRSLETKIMGQNSDFKLIVNHIANGTLGDKLCRICLQPLTSLYENIFTKICKMNEEYSIADILKQLCDISFSDSDYYNVCSECFVAASSAYKFYQKARKNDEILHFYTDKMNINLKLVDIPDFTNNESLYISLPAMQPDISTNNVKADNCNKKQDKKKTNQNVSMNVNSEKGDITKNSKSTTVIKEEEDDDNDLVIIMNEPGQPSFYKMQSDGSIVEVKYEDDHKAFNVEKAPQRKSSKRGPIPWKQCSKCPIGYRFFAKLKKHMSTEHGIMLFACKICRQLVEGEDEFSFHMATHTNKYECDICTSVFKKRSSMIAHILFHENMESCDYVCLDCGAICKDEASSKLHIENHNVKDFTCYFCGRMYKKGTGFYNHIKKHEMYNRIQELKKQQGDANVIKLEFKQDQPKRDCICELCGRSFRGRRALLWHSRLHTNERPFTCDVCGRGFVSLNRRNQHSLCAHTAPTRRCPLCPALFHMRSMVNTHIRKVHLKTHKRRTRTVRQQNVSWHTAPVPIEELSIAIQNDILELQAASEDLTTYVYES